MTINPFDDAMSVPRRHHNHRPRSPTKRHRAYSPSSRADDISRLLDPAYASPTRRAEGVYVDHHGELHDPDFKLFPPLPKPKAPRWERDAGDELDALDDEEEPRETRRYTPSPSFTPSYAAPSSYARTSYYVAPQLPASYDSEDTVLGSVAPSFDDEKQQKARRSGLKLRIRRRNRRNTDATAVEEEEPSPSDASPSPLTPAPLAGTPEAPRSLYPQHPPSPRRHRRASIEEPVEPAYDEEEMEEPELEEDEEEDAPHTPDADETPSCTKALRLQWQAFTLRMRFGAFRVERKVKKRLERRKEKT
ncbi:hypothetical protein BD626DRAFT_570880 [Schizophyllum amplum]|uniref:Uncharacterized protein n=1 Tax=Schizophyllum amplum TaxID=97359 RepID=A0A550C955_9AGAR|nr:hypothetical protein BD626DRAFT_570880 [Auriculariopsis ampla]